jgi:predicted DNA-binding antitoxin AbrB/MazE fold protein
LLDGVRIIAVSIVFEAVWENGVLTPKTPLDLPEGSTVHLVIEVIEEIPPSRTALGADLRAIRERIVASGIPLLTKEEILQEIHERRGDYPEQDE